MPVSRRARVPLLLLLAVLAGLAALGVQLALRAPPELPPAPAARLGRAIGSSPLPVPVAAQPSVEARALFTPSRRFDPAPPGPEALATAGAPPADPFLGVTLVGTARARGYAAAVVRDANGRLSTLRPGGDIAGWRLAGVGEAAAVFRRGTERRALRLGQAAMAAGSLQQFSPDLTQEDE